jgi:hypothetical protein
MPMITNDAGHASPQLMTPDESTRATVTSGARPRRRIPGPAGQLATSNESNGRRRTTGADEQQHHQHHQQQQQQQQHHHQQQPRQQQRQQGEESRGGAEATRSGSGGKAGGERSDEAAFRSGPWRALLEARGLAPFGDVAPLPLRQTLAWIEREAAWRKASRLAIYVAHVTLTATDAVLLAKDPTGEMLATLHVSFFIFL